MRNKILVGCFDIGNENVNLFALPSQDGGEIRIIANGEGKVAEINIGLDYEDWYEVVDTLLHETLEFIATRKELRFERTCKFRPDHGDYLFVFDHPQFFDMCSRAAVFITPALPRLAEIFDRERKKRKAKR